MSLPAAPIFHWRTDEEPSACRTLADRIAVD
jgi:hypothetical protein